MLKWVSVREATSRMRMRGESGREPVTGTYKKPEAYHRVVSAGLKGLGRQEGQW